jgi:hypothetical protein
MSFVDTKNLVVERMTLLGFKEWRDGFNSENIPSTLLDGSFHFEYGPISSGPANQRAHQFTMSFTIRVFFKGYRDPYQGIDESLVDADEILAELLSPQIRLSQPCIKDIRPVSIQPIPLQNTNDNALILEMNFQSILFSVY